MTVSTYARTAAECRLPQRSTGRRALGEAENGSGAYYLNSGSTGRHENLIWCVEICGDVDTVVSWSRIDGTLTRIAWRSDGDKLVHA